MGSPAASAGIARGFQGSLANARERRIAEEERQRQHKREDLLTEGAQFDLARARIGAQREDQQFASSKAEFDKRIQEEGFLDFANALSQGVDPNIAMQAFNKAGKLQLSEVGFDPQSGRLRLLDSDGETQEFDNPSQMLAAVGIRKQPEELVKLGKDDRLVSPTTGKTRVPAVTTAGDNLVKVGDALYDKDKNEWKLPPNSKDRYIEVDKSLYDTEKGTWISPPGGGDSGRDTSPFNPETALKNIEQGIIRSHGGSFDALGNYSVPGDREIVDAKVALAGESFSRLDDYVRGGKIGYTEIENAVVRASKGLQTESELEKAGEEWRTKGRNKSEEDKQNWVAMERDRQVSDARRKLAAEEQKILARAAGKTGTTSVEKPGWAGNEIPPDALGDAKLEPGKEYDVQDEGGDRLTIRVAPDGKVYEVKGQPQANAAPPARQQPAPAAPVEQSAPEPNAPQPEPEEDDGMLASIRDTFNDVRASRRAKVALEDIQDGKQLRPREVEFLNNLDDNALRKLGLDDEQIQMIRSLAVADQSLAAIRRDQPETNY